MRKILNNFPLLCGFVLFRFMFVLGQYLYCYHTQHYSIVLPIYDAYNNAYQNVYCTLLLYNGISL